MSQNKRYFYMQLHEGYFHDSFQGMLESLKNGYEYSIIRLKLTLLTLNSFGKLVSPDGIPFSEKTLARMIGHREKAVVETLEILKRNDKINTLENGVLQFDLSGLIGSRTSEADRQKKIREKKNSEPPESPEDSSIFNPTGVYNRTPNIESGLHKNTLLSLKSFDTPEIRARFDTLWGLYPRKDGKKEAYEAYLKALKEGVSDIVIRKGILNYCEYIEATDREPDFVKTGGRWFSQQCWNNENAY